MGIGAIGSGGPAPPDLGLNSVPKTDLLELAKGIASAKGVGHSGGGVGAATQMAADLSVAFAHELATTDLAALSRILEPQHSHAGLQVLHELLGNAVRSVAQGNLERAVGYLADYATRDPQRAEALPSVPGLEVVRDKVDQLLGRMTNVAKMSAQDGLAHAEQAAQDSPAKIPHWDTSPEVLLKVAHHLFEAGGYSNYTRTTELTRAISDPAYGQGLLVPYVVAPPLVGPVLGPDDLEKVQSAETRIKSDLRGAAEYNWAVLKEVFPRNFRLVWQRAPLLVLLLSWLMAGIAGGLLVAMFRNLSPDGLLAAWGDFGFEVWALGFLALVGLGFYAGIRRRR